MPEAAFFYNLTTQDPPDLNLLLCTQILQLVRRCRY
jgi:hypothetical protein